MEPLFWQSFLQGIVQGITEFLPVSSTGHMIIVDHFIQMEEQFSHLFEVVVQLGSILSVLVYFHKKLFPVSVQTGMPAPKFMTADSFNLSISAGTGKRFVLAIPRDVWQKTIAAVIPALLIGGLFGSKIQHYLYNIVTVACALVIGGIVLILVDRTEKKNMNVPDIQSLSIKKAVWIGLIQCLAMIPGTSRSASTIIGAMALGCSRSCAAEFSFFLAIPTMAAASGYQLLKYGARMSVTEWIALGIGFITAFFVAWAVIAFFMAYIRKHDFRLFAWYRIVFGLLLLVLFFTKTI